MDLRRLFPEIPWDEPLRVQRPGVDTYACRYCLTAHGVPPVQLRDHEASYGDIRAHIQREHGGGD